MYQLIQLQSCARYGLKQMWRLTMATAKSDGFTIKKSYGVYVLLHRPFLHPIFSYWVGLVKIKSDFIVRSVETALGK